MPVVSGAPMITIVNNGSNGNLTCNQIVFGCAAP